MASLGSIATAPLRAQREGDKNAKSIVFLGLLWFAILFAVLALVVLLVTAFVDGRTRLDANLIEVAQPGRMNCEHHHR